MFQTIAALLLLHMTDRRMNEKTRIALRCRIKIHTFILYYSFSLYLFISFSLYLHLPTLQGLQLLDRIGCKRPRRRETLYSQKPLKN